MMDRGAILATVASVSRKRSHAVQGDVSLGSLGLSTSIGLEVLRSRLEKAAGRDLPALTLEMSVEVLCELVLSGAIAVDPVGEAGSAQSVSGIEPAASAIPIGASFAADLGVGLDIQQIDMLPETTDYRDDAFYASHFLPSEIATALLRPDPRATLCGLFCVKEAAKKSHPLLLNLRMTELVVSHDANGRPYLAIAPGTVLTQKFRFRISISHTGGLAAATCIAMGAAE
jgi:holo-[acyl-carrier protein] synthase